MRTPFKYTADNHSLCHLTRTDKVTVVALSMRLPSSSLRPLPTPPLPRPFLALFSGTTPRSGRTTRASSKVLLTDKSHTCTGKSSISNHGSQSRTLYSMCGKRAQMGYMSSRTTSRWTVICVASSGPTPRATTDSIVCGQHLIQFQMMVRLRYCMAFIKLVC